METETQKANEETQAIVETPHTQAIAPQTQAIEETPIAPQVRVTKNPRKVAAGRKVGLARKAMAYNTDHSLIKTWAPYVLGVVAIAAVWFFKTGEEKTPQVKKLDEVQLELSPHVIKA